MKRKSCETSDLNEECVSLNKNRIYFYSDITKESCFNLIHKINEAKEYVKVHCELEQLIYLHICSDGGDLLSSLAVIDTILNSEIKIITICEGCVASAGVLVSLAGNERYMRKHSYMLIHELRSSCYGKYTECKDDMENNDILMKDMIKYINKRCQNKNLELNLEKFLKRDLLWNSKKCLKYGLITKIL